jgi:Ku protein
MRDKNSAALGRIVMANREHVMAIEPLEKGMLGTTLRYPYELRDTKPYFSGIRSPRVPRETVRLAEHILDSKAGHFDPSKFKDEYERALKQLVRRKAKGHVIEEPEERPEPSNVIDLMDALRRSLEGEKRGRRSSGARRARASRRKGRARASTRRKAA